MPKKGNSEKIAPIPESPAPGYNLIPLAQAWETYAEKFRGSFMPRVCLGAPSGSGKTARVNEFAKRIGLPLRTLLLGSQAEEDILGLPSVVDGHTIHTLPSWASSKEAVVLFIDELDKASPERQAAILTLLAQKKVHDYSLHPDTILICAMQPLEEIGEWLGHPTGVALAERLAFVPLTSERGYLVEKYSLTNRICELPTDKNMTMPLSDVVSNRSLEACLQARTQGIALEHALFSPSVAKLVTEILAEQNPTTYLVNLFAEGLDPDAIPEGVWKEMTPALAQDLLGSTAHALHVKTFKRLYREALNGSPLDTYPELISKINANVISHGSRLCGDATLEEFAKEFWDAHTDWGKTVMPKLVEDAKRNAKAKTAQKDNK